MQFGNETGIKEIFGPEFELENKTVSVYSQIIDSNFEDFPSTMFTDSLIGIFFGSKMFLKNVNFENIQTLVWFIRDDCSIIFLNSQIRELGTRLFYYLEDVSETPQLAHFVKVLTSKDLTKSSYASDHRYPNGFMDIFQS
jgi:hypothetical protein